MATAHAPRKNFIDVLNNHERTRSIPPGILTQSKESLAKVLTGLALDLPKTKMPNLIQQKMTTDCTEQHSNVTQRRLSLTLKSGQQEIKQNFAIQNKSLARPTTPDAHPNKQLNLPVGIRNLSAKPTPTPLISKEQLATTINKRSEATNAAVSRQAPTQINLQTNNNARTRSIPPSLNRKEVAQGVQSGTATTIIKANLNQSKPTAKTTPKPLIRTQTALSILPQKIGPIDQTKVPVNNQVNLPPTAKRNSVGALMPVQTKHSLPKIEQLDAKPKKIELESNEVFINLHFSNDSQAHNDFIYRPSWHSVTITAASLVDVSGFQRKMTSAKIISDTAGRQKRLRSRTARPAKMTIKAVFFDLYGVYVRYLDNDSALALIRNIITTPSLREKIFDYERGKYSCEECLDVVSVVHPPLKEADDLENVDFWSIVAGVDENIEKAIRKLKENGYKVGILCNNAYWTPRREKSMIPDDMSLFDIVVESCKLGYRKSDPEIYWLAAEALGLECHECVLVDDSMLNVHGALDQGMFGIKQNGEDSKSAVEELENLLYVKLH